MSSTDNWSVIVALISLATQVVEKCGLILLGIGKNWRTGRKELDEHAANVQALRRQLEERELTIRRHGHSDSALASRVEVARNLLVDEEENTKRLAISVNKWKRRVAALAFPNELSYRTIRVDDAVKAIDLALEDAAKYPPLLRGFGDWEPVKLNFQRSKRYTANKASEEDVKNRLKIADIVVLHGEPGSGKTCLAKELGLDFEEESDIWKKTEKSAGKQGAGGQPAFLDGVFFVECGPAAEVTKVYQTLLRDLGIAGPWVASSDQDGSEPAQPPPDEARLKNDLKRGLRELSALVILDNVCDQEIVDAVIVPKKAGVPGRKYLVTTRNLKCIPSRGDLDFVKMGMDQEAARELLLKFLEDESGDNASAVNNLQDQITNKGIQELEEKMIKETNGNPQALVCFAELLKGRVLHKERWEELLDPNGEFFSTLDNEKIAERAGHSSTIFKSMIASVRTLSEEQPRALELLLFLALCDTPVPENVLRSVSCLLDKKQDIDQETKTGKRRFPLMVGLDLLVNWSLIDYTTRDVMTQTEVQRDSKTLRSENERKMYRVPSLRRRVILEAMREEWQSLRKKLMATEGPEVNADDPSEGKLVTELCAVYSVAMAEGHPLGLKGTETETRKKFVKEAVWLLHSELEGIEVSAEQKNAAKVQKQKVHKHGKKVIVQVLSDGSVDNKDIIDMLQLPQPVPLTVCRALKELSVSQAPTPRVDQQQRNSNQTLQSTSDNGDGSDAASSSASGAGISLPGRSSVGSENRNSIVTQYMRGLKLEILVGSLRKEGKPAPTIVQLNALEVCKEYIDNAKARSQELDHFLRNTPTGASELKCTIDVLVDLLRTNEDIEVDIGKLKLVLSMKDAASFRTALTDGLRNLQNQDSDLEVSVEEVEATVKVNLEELKKPQLADEVEAKEKRERDLHILLQNLGKILDEALKRVLKIREISIDMLKTLLNLLEDEEKEKYRSQLQLLAPKVAELIPK